MKVEIFEWIFEQQKQTNEIITNHFNKKLKTTIEDEENYQNSQDYWICDKKIIKNNDKVRDQCHITGKYTGSTHRECNSKLKIPKNLPIIFNNLEGSDGHLIFRELNKFKNIDIKVIPKSREKYMSIIINKNIVFFDSLQFCTASLDDLAENLEDKNVRIFIR